MTDDTLPSLPAADSPAGADLLDRFWRSCRGYGVDRRAFLRAVSAGAAGSFLAACAGGTTTPADSTQEVPAPAYFKDPTRLIPHGARNLETRLAQQRGLLTPEELFFVRNNSSSQAIDPDTYRLRVGGDAAQAELELELDDLLGMPSRTVLCTVECGGNHRAFFDLVMGRAASGTQWQTGGISMAEWTGVPLAEVLLRAGLAATALDVQLVGLDTDSPEQGWRRPLPLAKALDPDTILAYRMNGAELPPDHGFPLRAVVPGWVGSSSVKWLGSIEISSQRIWSRNVTTSYVLIGDDYPLEGEAEGQVAREQSIKSALALPWPARLRPGPQLIRGYAQSPSAAIARVQWSIDDGATWSPARLIEPLMRYAWARFEIDWDAPAGVHTLITRAIDAAGNSQPQTLPFNEKGYLFNLPLPHPISVG